VETQIFALHLKTKKMATKTTTKQTGSKLTNKSFMNADDLCDFINKNKIKPFSLNVTERFYMVFYYEKQ
jgi:hypothetical protein